MDAESSRRALLRYDRSAASKADILRYARFLLGELDSDLGVRRRH